jgi:hypothetical protein
LVWSKRLQQIEPRSEHFYVQYEHTVELQGILRRQFNNSVTHDERRAATRIIVDEWLLSIPWLFPARPATLLGHRLCIADLWL